MIRATSAHYGNPMPEDPDAYKTWVADRLAALNAAVNPDRAIGGLVENPEVNEPEPEYLGPAECDLRADGERASRMGWTR